MQALLPPPPPLPLHAGDDGPQYVPPPTPELERMLREEGVLGGEASDEEGRRRQLRETADALAMLQTPPYAQDAREFVGRAGIVSTMVQMVAHAGEEQRDPRAVRAYVACEAVRAFDKTVARGGTPPPLHVLIREAEAALRAYGGDRGDHCSDV